MRTALPWILLALVAGGWIATTLIVESNSAVGSAAEDDTATQAELQQTISALRAEVKTLRKAQPSEGPELATSGKRPAVPPAGAQKPVETPEARAKREALAERRKRMWAQRKAWGDAVRSLKDKAAREQALGEMRAAFDGADEERRLAALLMARWLGNVTYDRADWRGAILPHAKSADPEVRLAALTALAYVQPEASDIGLWKEAVAGAGRSNGEEIAQAIVRTAGGVLEGEAAEAVLHLLRDGTRIKRAMVIRGLQSVKTWDPAVEARLLEVVRTSRGGDSVEHYYFHFIAARLDPKSDAVLDLILEKIETGRGGLQTIVRGFRTGLDDRQKERAADALIDCAENAPDAYTVRLLAEALGRVAGARHIARMEALIAGEDVDKYARMAVEDAIRQARRRS